MSIISKKFKERLMKEKEITIKIANVRIKKLSKILESNGVLEYFSKIEEFETKISQKIKEIIIEEIDELIKEKQLNVKETNYIFGYSDKKNIIDVVLDCEKNSYLLSFEIFARKENMSIEYFENIKKESLFSEEGSIFFMNTEGEEITRKYISMFDAENKSTSYTCFDMIKKNNEVILKNLLSDDEIILNENEYQKYI